MIKTYRQVETLGNCRDDYRLPHEAIQIDATTFTQLDDDSSNAMLFERNADRPVEGVIADLRRSCEEVIATLEHLNSSTQDLLLALA
jgi:hypothetical protein